MMVSTTRGDRQPRTRTALAAAAAALSALLLPLVPTACGGSGGGITPTPPNLVLVAFSGASMTPAAGDMLLLGFDEDVALVAGALLTDEDLVLSGGATLGNVTMAPTLVNTRTVAVTLGAGTTIVPATTTATFSDENDVVTDAAGTLAIPGTALTVTVGDGDTPTISRVTLNTIPTELNGAGPAGGTLQVPQTGFTIDVTATDVTSAIAEANTVISANVGVVANGVLMAANTNLTPFLSRTGLSFTVTPNVVFTAGAVTLSIQVADASGIGSAVSTFSFVVGAFTAANRPFESGQLWFIDTSRDLENYTIGSGGSTLPVSVTAGANGTADLEDLLRELGLLSATDSLSTNATVLQRFLDEFLADLQALYNGVNVTFTFTSPGTFSGTSVPYASGTFSQICLAGAANSSGTGFTLGAALFDTNNQFHDNDCLENFSGSRLGVFLYTLVDLGYSSGGPTSFFQSTYRPFTSGAGGTPLGDEASDAMRLAGSVTDSRSVQIDTAIARLAKAAAVIMAHECGHSMGLIANGAMPTGLFGNDATNFPLSGGQPASNADGHIQNDSLFSSLGAINVMAPALSFEETVDDDTAFNPLSLAYLRERAIYFQ